VAGAVVPATLAQRQRRIAGPTKTTSSKANDVRNNSKSKSTRRASMQEPDQQGVTIGVPTTGEKGIQRTNAEIMRAQVNAPPSKRPKLIPEREVPGRKERPQDPNAKPVASTPDLGFSAKGNVVRDAADPLTPDAPQPLGTTFNALTGPTENGAIPPDTMGAVGPTQFFLFVNGRLRTFNKTTGVADGVVEADPDVFFALVMSPFPPGGLNFTSDPQIRYDRLTSRWIMTIIDVPSTSITSIGDIPNRILIAVSDAASAGVISGGTVWTFYFVQQDTVGGPSTGEFLDYPSLGVDDNALYIGGNMFNAASGGFNNTAAFVIRKTSVLSGGPVVTTAFRNLVGADGPTNPRGVDNYDTAATEGYFIGVSAIFFGRLNMRRISTPGGTPAISADIQITVSATTFPITVDHLGDTGGTSGNVDALDDRLFAAHIRNGRLWTAHNIAVDAAGVASGGAQRRNAARWYELVVPPTVGTPTVNQSGTIFDTAATVATARQFFIPSVMVSGQGHAAIGYSTAGTPFRIDAATNGRLVGDTLGTTGAVSIYTASSTAYNPPGDPGPPRRWGDYSFTTLDPLDDMTMWTVQQFCNATNTYGVQVVKLLAPPPATPTTGSAVALGQASVNAPIVGTSSSGSGFYDPGANPAAPHTPFNHISAFVNGAGAPTVNSVTYTDPTHITLSLNTSSASSGNYTVTITNPDGQSVTSGLGRTLGGISVGPSAAPAIVSGRITTPGGSPLGGAVMRLNGAASRTTVSDAAGNYRFDNLETDNFYTVTPSLANYTFSPANRSFSLTGNRTDEMFTANPDATQSANAIDTVEYFVRQQYLDFLGREPDQGGLEYWSSQFNGCNGDATCIRNKRIDVSAAFFASLEFQQTGSYIYGLYAGTLGRTPGYGEFMPDRAQVVGGSGLEPAKAAFAQNFVQRAEFTNRYPQSMSREQFVDAVIQTMSTRSGVDHSSLRNGLLSDYDAGGRALVVRHASEAGAFVAAEYNRAFVLMEYFGYLRRDIDPGGYAFWLDVLNRGAGSRGMVCSFLTSTEYQNRFSAVVTHSNAECQ
jgi:Domain of unknown function (DUF4214)